MTRIHPGATSIEALIYDAARLIDDGQFDDWAKLFVEDCSYKIITRENADNDYPATLMSCKGGGMVRDRALALREANLYNPHYDRHVIGNVRIFDETDGVYSVHSCYMVAQTTLDGRSSLFSVGKYIDRVVFENGDAKFKERTVVADTGCVDNLMATPL